jgi:hypothetical protein
MESKKRKNYWGGILVILGVLLLYSCITEPALPNFEKGIKLPIDSAVLYLYSSSDSFLFSHILNVNSALSDPLGLDTNKTYHSEMKCFSNGVEQNSLIVSQARFYLFTNYISKLNNNNLQMNTTDVDDQNLSIGLKNTWHTALVTSDSLLVNINGWYYAEAVKGIKNPTGSFFDVNIPVILK